MSRLLGIPNAEQLNDIINGEQSFVIISAEIRCQHDEARTSLLEKEISKYEYYTLAGWWYENEQFKKPKDVELRDYQKSFLVIDMSKADALRLAKAEFIPEELWKDEEYLEEGQDRNAQDAIIYSEPGEKYIESISATSDQSKMEFVRTPTDIQDFKYGFSRFSSVGYKILGAKWAFFSKDEAPTTSAEEDIVDPPEEEEVIEPTPDIDNEENATTEAIKRQNKRKALRESRQ